MLQTPIRSQLALIVGTGSGYRDEGASSFNIPRI